MKCLLPFVGRWLADGGSTLLDRYPKLSSSDAKVVTLRDWLLAEAAEDERALADKRHAEAKR